MAFPATTPTGMMGYGMVSTSVKPAARIEVVEIVFLMVMIFVASTVALHDHDDPAHNDVHTACHEAIQSVRISVQCTGTVPMISPAAHVLYIVLVMNVAFY